VPDASQRREFSPRPPKSRLIQPDRTSQLASTEANRPKDRALASKLANNVNIYFERRSSSAQILSEEAPLNQTAQALGNVDRKPEPVATSYSRSEPSALWEHNGLEQSSNEHADSIDDGKPGIGASRINDLHSRAEAAAAVALTYADAVDREARFPTEAFLSARTHRLLGMMVPADLGGEGASLSDAVDVCYILARGCSSTAMIFAMHQIMVAILVRHARNSPWHNRLLRSISSEQLLLASSTTEGRGGGDLRTSVCAVERSGSGISLTRNATVMSYGEHADALLTTARRSLDSSSSDQVLVAFMKDDYQLEPIMNWDTLGMRGTCSSGFTLKATGDMAQVLPDPYEKIQSHTMMPVAHLTWAAVWSGLAAAAVERARRCVRAAVRSGVEQTPGAAHLTRATMSLRALRGILSSALQRLETAGANEHELESLEFQNAMNLLKVSASEIATSTVMSAMQACGLSGYRNDGEFSVSRHLRDVLSSSIMINNERILANAATASLLIEVPHSLRG
jgi:acyl-CoA dehydrogenase